MKQKEIIYYIESFHNECERNKFCRYNSWEYCYEAFNSNNSNKDNYDFLSLNLAFYLASWGMYRGSSFLLQKDYKIHNGAVKIILNKKYRILRGISCNKLKEDENIELLFNLKNELNKYYSNIKHTTKNHKNDKNISDTLLSKILLGTLGCVPAFDRYLKIGLNECKLTQKFSKKSIKDICSFYERVNIGKNSKVNFKTKVKKIKYPQMKLIDMGLWNLGRQIEEGK